MEGSSPLGSALSIERHALANGATLLSLVGELDLASMHVLAQELEELSDGAQSLVLDLRRLQFIDSTGLHVLLRADRQLADTGGQLTIVRGPQSVDRLFRLTGLDTRLRIVEPGEIDLPSP
jgi:anti-sigma B factor antagonist